MLTTSTEHHTEVAIQYKARKEIKDTYFGNEATKLQIQLMT